MICTFCIEERNVRIRRVPPDFTRQSPICPRCYRKRAGTKYVDGPTPGSTCGAAGLGAKMTLDEIEKWGYRTPDRAKRKP